MTRIYCMHCSALTNREGRLSGFGRCAACDLKMRLAHGADALTPRNYAGQPVGLGSKAQARHREDFVRYLRGGIYDKWAREHEAEYGFRPEYHDMDRLAEAMA
jgi:hypothetical protein